MKAYATTLLAAAYTVAILCFPMSVHGGAQAEKQQYIIAIDVGHSLAHPGATSARGYAEHDFNARMASELLQQLKDAGYSRAQIMYPQRGDTGIKWRLRQAAAMKADIIISLHHDSAQPAYMSTWTTGGRQRRYSDNFHGYSIFYSAMNAKWRESLALATMLGTEMLKRGLSPTLHHAEKIPGEGRELVDTQRGIYRFDDLIILGRSAVPAILLECGLIVNRQEEHMLNDPQYRRRITDAITSAIEQFSRATPKTP